MLGATSFAPALYIIRLPVSMPKRVQVPKFQYAQAYICTGSLSTRDFSGHLVALQSTHCLSCFRIGKGSLHYSIQKLGAVLWRLRKCPSILCNVKVQPMLVSGLSVFPLFSLSFARILFQQGESLQVWRGLCQFLCYLGHKAPC